MNSASDIKLRPPLFPNEKYLLCRPHGGLNDTLCQIAKCWKYSLRFNRILVIDTRNSGLHGDFFDFFEFRNNSKKIIGRISAETVDFLNRLTCFPVELRGKLHLKETAMASPDNLVLKDNPAVRLTFDFSKDYEHAVLVHEQWGGGRGSFDILDDLVLSSKIRPEVVDRIRYFAEKYCAVHIRNTDMKTDYKTFLNRISPDIRGHRLLVCSDDAGVIAFARSFFDKLEILTSSQIPDTKGRPLHNFSDQNYAIDAIVDVIALGKSERLFLPTPAEGGQSGFSQLAAHIFRNKYVIQNLLRLPRSDLPITTWRMNLYWRRAREQLRRTFDMAPFPTRRSQRTTL